MPILVTEEFQGKQLYFDMRTGGTGETKEGFWAVPIFESKRREIIRKAEASGKTENFISDLLCYAIRSWEGFFDLNGEEIPCTEDNIRKLCESDSAAMSDIFARIIGAGRLAKVMITKN